jgi:hypothetical protein
MHLYTVPHTNLLAKMWAFKGAGYTCDLVCDLMCDLIADAIICPTRNHDRLHIYTIRFHMRFHVRFHVCTGRGNYSGHEIARQIASAIW